MNNFRHAIAVGALLDNEDRQVAICFGQAPSYDAASKTTSSNLRIVIVSGRASTMVTPKPALGGKGVAEILTMTSTSFKSSGSFVWRGMVSFGSVSAV